MKNKFSKAGFQCVTFVVQMVTPDFVWRRMIDSQTLLERVRAIAFDHDRMQHIRDRTRITVEDVG